MNPKKYNNKFKGLAAKALSTIAASITILNAGQANASALVASDNVESKNNLFASKSRLKPNLVLKLNMSSPSESRLMMHTSHSSHSSHSSHASHASHSSSSPSYRRTYTSPAYTPTYPVVSSPTTYPSRNSSTSSYPSFTLDTVRTLVKGMYGEDVKRMQQLLKNKGYSSPVSGYFGSQTEVAVKKFQKISDLPENGKVDSLTLSMILH